jgi:AcrR family transcriptional regulator
MSGVDAPAKEITDKTDVGVGTLYRHFPRRSDLIAAVMQHEIDVCGDAGTTLGGEHEPDVALAQWLYHLTELVGTKPGLASALHSGDPAFDQLPDYLMQSLEPVLAALLDSATSSGAVRPDVSARDLLHAVAMLRQPVPGERTRLQPAHGDRLRRRAPDSQPDDSVTCRRNEQPALVLTRAGTGEATPSPGKHDRSGRPLERWRLVEVGRWGFGRWWRWWVRFPDLQGLRCLGCRVVVSGIVGCGAGIGQRRLDGFGLDGVAAAERCGPDEAAGCGLFEGPARLRLEGVVVAAQRGEVGGDGLATVPVLDGVVLIAAAGAVAAGDADARAVADLGVAAQRGAG